MDKILRPSINVRGWLILKNLKKHEHSFFFSTTVHPLCLLLKKKKKVGVYKEDIELVMDEGRGRGKEEEEEEEEKMCEGT